LRAAADAVSGPAVPAIKVHDKPATRALDAWPRNGFARRPAQPGQPPWARLPQEIPLPAVRPVAFANRHDSDTFRHVRRPRYPHGAADANGQSVVRASSTIGPPAAQAVSGMSPRSRSTDVIKADHAHPRARCGPPPSSTCQRNVIRHCRQSTVGGTNATLAAAQSQEN